MISRRPSAGQPGVPRLAGPPAARPWRRPVAALFCALALVSGGGLHADPLFHIRSPETEFEMFYETEDERQSSPFTAKDQQTTAFKPRLDVTTDGWLYHPDLVTFSVGLQPERRREVAQGLGGFNRTVNSSFLGYSVDALFLRAKPYTFKVVSGRSRSEFDSSLSQNTITKSQFTRAVLLLQAPTLPTTITYENRDVDHENLFSFHDVSEVFRVEANHRGAATRASLTSEYLRQDRRTNDSGFSVDRWEASFNNRYQFGTASNWNSSIRAIDSSSELFETRILAASESLILEHRPKLRSRYTVRYDERRTDDFEATAFNASAGVTHQLYDNLVTAFDLRADENRFGNGEVSLAESTLEFRYKRTTPWGGIQLDNGYGYRVEDNDVDALLTNALNELHVLTETVPVFLENANVDTTSIVVTDTSVTVIYREDIDYVVTLIGSAVAIERTLFGSIADGQEVLVSYDFVPDLPFKRSRTTVRFGTKLDLKNMAQLYYSQRRVTEDLLSGAVPAVAGDGTERRAGGELRWRWSKSRLDYEKRDDAQSALSRWRAQQSISFQLNHRFSVSGSFTYAETDLKDNDEDTTDRGAFGTIRWRIARWGDLEVKALARNVEGNSQDSTNEGVATQLVWRYGAWRGVVRYENLSDRDDVTDLMRDRKRVSLQVRRRFR